MLSMAVGLLRPDAGNAQVYGVDVWEEPLLAGLYALDLPPGLEWSVPLFFLKVLVAHLLPEEAYRPHKEGAR